MLMRSAVFWDIMRHHVVIVYHTTPHNIPKQRIPHKQTHSPEVWQISSGSLRIINNCKYLQI
jgi:hypothetical protein